MPIGIIAAVVSVVISAASYIKGRQAAKRAKESAEDAAAVQISGHNSNRGLYVVYGEAMVGSTIVWKKVSRHKAAVNVFGGFKLLSTSADPADTGTSDDHRWFYRVVSLAHGPVEDITNVTIDGQAYNDDRFKKRTLNHFASVVSLGPAAGEHWNRLINKSSTEFREWDSTKLGKGTAYAVERLWSDKKSPAFQGEPDTKYVIKGRKVYDPRLDGSIPGGTGLHRSNDATTWEYSTNPVLCLLDYITNIEYGRGLSHADDIDLTTFQDAADECDVSVAIPARLTNTTGGTVTVYNPFTGQTFTIVNTATWDHYRAAQSGTSQPRFSCNVALDPEKSVKENMEILLNTFRGHMPFVNGKYQVVMEDVASPVMSLTDDDIIGGLQVQSGDRSERTNRATCKFLNSNKNHREDQVSWPKTSDAQYTTYLNEDQGEALHQQFTLHGVTDHYQAEDIAEFIVRDSRATLSARGRFTSRTMRLVPGDVIDLTYDSASWVSKYFKVVSVSVDMSSLETSLELREYDSSVYTWNASKGNEPLGFSWTNANVNDELTAPVIGTITSASSTNADGSTNITVTVPFTGIPAEATIAELLWARAGTGDWQSVLIPDPDGTQSSVEFIVPQGGVSYDVRLRYRTIGASGAFQYSLEDTDSITPVDPTGTKLGGIEAGATNGADWDTNVANKPTVIQTYIQAGEPGGASAGELWIDSDDGNRLYRHNGSIWVDVQDTDIGQAITDAAGAQGTADNKVFVFAQVAQPVNGDHPEGLLETGDLWVDTDDSNRLYRFNGSTWDDMRDGGISTALSDAANAQATADGKIVSYYQDAQPGGGSEGDIWVDTNDSNKLYRHNGTIWQDARDATIDPAQSDATTAITNAATAQATADGKVTTFVATTEPTAEGVGDLWMDTDDDNKIYRWSGSTWVPYVQDTADWGKVTNKPNVIETFVATTEPTANNPGDLWIDSDDGNKLYRWNGSTWINIQDGLIGTAITNAAGAQGTADNKVFIFAQIAQPVNGDHPEGLLELGDLWIDTDDSNRLYRFNGTIWVDVRDGGISQALSDASNAQATADGKIISYYQDAEPGGGSEGDIWVDTNDNNKLYRHNGTIWQDARDASIDPAQADATTAITNAATAQATADGKVTTFIGGPSAPTAEGVGDLWMDTSDDNHMYRWSGSAWISYVQDTANWNKITGVPSGLVEVYYATTMPGGGVEGDIWLDSDDGYRMYRHNGTTFVDVQDGQIGTAITNAAGAQGTADNKVYIFAQAAEPVGGDHPEGVLETGDLWIETDNGNHLHRYNGATWDSVIQDEADWAKVFGAAKPEDNATLGAKVGTNLKDSADNVLDDIDVRNDQLVISALGGINFNPSLSHPQTMPGSTNLGPAGWISNSALASDHPTYVSDAVRDVMRVGTGNIEIVGSVVPVVPSTVYRITVIARSTVVTPTASTFDIRANEEYDPLPNGITYITATTGTGDGRQVGDNSQELLTNQTFNGSGGSFFEFSTLYQPTPGTRYFSPSLYNSNAVEGFDVDSVVVSIAGTQDLANIGGMILNGDMLQYDAIRDAPVGWYQWDNATNMRSRVNDSGTIALRLGSASGDTVSVNSGAWAVSPTSRYKIKLRMRGSITDTDGIYIRVHEYDGELSGSERFVSRSIGTALSEDDPYNVASTREVGFTAGTAHQLQGHTFNGAAEADFENMGINAAYQEYEVFYNPTPSAKWASVAIYKWVAYTGQYIWIDHVSVVPTAAMPSLANFMPAGYADFEGLGRLGNPAGYFSESLGTNNYGVTSGQSHHGNYSMYFQDTDDVGAGLYMGGSAANGGTYHVKIPAARRWLVVAWVRATSTTGLVGCTMWDSGGVTDGHDSGQAVAAANTWEQMAWELDMTTETTTTAVQLRFYNTTAPISAGYYIDELMLLDVTDYPFITKDNHPTEFVPVGGGVAADGSTNNGAAIDEGGDLVGQMSLVGGSIVALEDITVTHTVSNQANGIIFRVSNTAGNLYRRSIETEKESFGLTTHHQWLIGGDPLDWECQFSETSSTNMTRSGSALDTWINLATTTPSWRYVTGTSQTGSLTGTLTLRLKADTSVTISCTVTLSLTDT